MDGPCTNASWPILLTVCFSLQENALSQFFARPECLEGEGLQAAAYHSWPHMIRAFHGILDNGLKFSSAKLSSWPHSGNDTGSKSIVRGPKGQMELFENATKLRMPGGKSRKTMAVRNSHGFHRLVEGDAAQNLTGWKPICHAWRA